VTAAETTDAGRRCADRVRGRAFIGATVALAVLFMGNNLPSALYGLLRAVFGFSSLVQTLLYAVPVVLVVLPGLLVFGTLSDVVGRRALVLTLGDSAGGLRSDPVAAQRLAALAGTISITGGLAVGPLLGGLLAQYAPAPRVTPLAVHLSLVAVAIALAWSIPGRPAGAAGR
jgi:hypothetical protein